MSGTRVAIIIGVIPVVLGLLYMFLQVTFAEPVNDFLAGIAGTIDPAGVVMLLALGLAMGFGFLVILRGARDL